MGIGDITKMLVVNGAKVNTRNVTNNTPLQDARQRGHKEIVEILIAHEGK